MPSPFPGMDLYLDHPDFWPHHWLTTLIAETLVPQVRPYYRLRSRAEPATRRDKTGLGRGAISRQGTEILKGA
ncbi:MAG: DUF4058 family protein [Cyanobacteria bacterium P01_A01_bin.114]